MKKAKKLRDQLKVVLSQKEQAIKARKKQIAIEEAANRSSKRGNATSNVNRPMIPYGAEHNILLIGEGNFSFADALARYLKENGAADAAQIFATSLDSEEVVHTKYPDALDHIQSLKELDATVLHDIDATQLRKVKALKDHKFDRIGFLFPHVGAGITDQERNIIANQLMLRGVFASCSSLLSQNGQVLVVLKEKEPYLSWNIKKIAKEAGLQCLRSWEWHHNWYPGYTHRRTLGFQEGMSSSNNEELKGQCREYSFGFPGTVADLPVPKRSKNVAEPKKRRGNDSDDSSEEEDDKSKKKPRRL